MFKNRCYNGGKKHNFKPRYSEEDKINIPNKGSIRYFDVKELKDFFTNKKYECDVCTWCGKIIKK